MNPRNNASGGPILSVRNYPIAADTKILVGQVVKLENGKVVAAAVNESGAILGIANETHEGTADALNVRANGKEILVADGPEQLMECAAPLVTATGGSATTVVATGLGSFSASDLQGGMMKLDKLAEASTNTDGVGTVKEIENFADGTFTVPSGGAAASGDQFRVFPPIGFAKGNLTADGLGLSLAAVDSISLKVVGWDLERGKILLLASKHALGNAE